jgi:erythrin-vacuolar iron transport family protein
VVLNSLMEIIRGLRRRPIWLTRNLPLDTIRKEAEIMEFGAERFCAKAAEQAQDVGVRKLLGDLADMEKGHESLAAKLTDTVLIPDVRAEEDRTRKRMFVLQYVQPGLAGLMDGSVSILAAFATHRARRICSFIVQAGLPTYEVPLVRAR